MKKLKNRLLRPLSVRRSARTTQVERALRARFHMWIWRWDRSRMARFNVFTASGRTLRSCSESAARGRDALPRVRWRLDIFPVFRLAEGLPGLRCLPRSVQPGVSLMERPHSVRSACLTQPLGAQASRLPGHGQRAALVACGHGCRRGRLRSQGGFALQKMSIGGHRPPLKLTLRSLSRFTG